MSSFGGFVHTTSLSTSPPNHNPLESLASNIIRDNFGPNIQLITDALLLLGPNNESATLKDIISLITKKEKVTKEMIVNGLLVLYQHSFISVNEKKDEKRKRSNITYALNVERILGMMRYARFLEYLPRFLTCSIAISSKKESSNIIFVAQCMLEELLLQGRMMTLELIEVCYERLKKEQIIQKQKKDEDNEEGDGDGVSSVELSSEEEEEVRERVLSGFLHLAEDGYITTIEFLLDSSEPSKDDENEMEFLQTIPIKHKQWITPGSAWEVNIPLFNLLIRAHILGRLISERYGDKILGAGAILTAAMKYQAYATHSPSKRFVLQQLQAKKEGEDLCFSPEDIVDYLPINLLVQWKNNPATVNIRQHLSTLLVSLSVCTFPQCILEIEEAAGHPKGGVFEVATRSILHHLQARTMYAIVRDRYGPICARICNILQTKGYLESEAIARYAMVPVKEVRTLLHTLYKSRYIQLLNMQQTKSHNPNTAIYLWTVHMPQLKKVIVNDTCTALRLLRLRRQHETEVGKDWIERAKEAGALDENDHEVDKVNYAKFCQGLERLDAAVLDLEETLMVLKDF